MWFCQENTIGKYNWNQQFSHYGSDLVMFAQKRPVRDTKEGSFQGSFGAIMRIAELEHHF